ncbi:MAG: hypothetical protein ACXWB9_05495 [Flavisolibacter sp.]
MPAGLQNTLLFILLLRLLPEFSFEDPLRLEPRSLEAERLLPALLFFSSFDNPVLVAAGLPFWHPGLFCLDYLP